MTRTVMAGLLVLVGLAGCGAKSDSFGPERSKLEAGSHAVIVLAKEESVLASEAKGVSLFTDENKQYYRTIDLAPGTLVRIGYDPGYLLAQDEAKYEGSEARQVKIVVADGPHKGVSGHLTRKYLRPAKD